MAELIKDKMFLVDNAIAANEELGIEPSVLPVRGGTDGAQLTYPVEEGSDVEKLLDDFHGAVALFRQTSPANYGLNKGNASGVGSECRQFVSQQVVFAGEADR